MHPDPFVLPALRTRPARWLVLFSLWLAMAATSGCITVAEHSAFVEAAARYRGAAQEVVRTHTFLTTQAETNWLHEDSDFGAAIDAARKPKPSPSPASSPK